jgi:hypothetical protein
MDNLTKKEEIIVFSLTRLFDKETLESELKEWIDGGMVDRIDSVMSMYKLMSVGEVRDDIDVQYLNYAIKFYEDIKNKDFSNPIERVKGYDYGVTSVETETMSTYYTTSFESLPSLLEKKKEDIQENFWDYDPERDVIDYLENSIDRLDLDSPDISYNTFFKNVIE